jgi:exopolysaccharide biosynthesis polyprenyl glycosylphosphotransferase
MLISNKKEALILFAGDVFFLLLSLWLMLLLRYQEVPSSGLFFDHLAPFSILFLVWIFIFFVSGLYEKHTSILKSRIPSIILNAQIVNSAIAVLFFYLVPFFGITPKTNLFIYLIVSFVFMLYWRIHGYSFLHGKNKQNAILIGSGDEMRELKEEVNNNSRYDLKFISSVDLNDIDSLDFQEEILKRVYSEEVQVIAADLKNEKVEPILPNLYNLIFSKVRFIDMYKIYEDIFDRVPLSLVKYNWFLENISTSPGKTYDALKRAMDIILALPLFIIVVVIFYPLVYLAIKFDDRGELFIIQERVGKNNKPIRILKFRTMSSNDQGNEEAVKQNKDTRVGKFLRKTRIDELPQLWNVIKGDVSLIGPRPELPVLVKLYEKEIPYYNVRHLIKPGLSGWAQLYQKDPPKVNANYDKTKAKLSYDLYYIKNRSFALDVKIALKTLKTFASRSGL